MNIYHLRFQQQKLDKMWLNCEFFKHLVMGQNEHLSLFTNISEDEGHGNLSISNLSPDLGPDFNNQVCTANLFVFDKYLSSQTMWQQQVVNKNVLVSDCDPLCDSSDVHCGQYFGSAENM